MNRTPHFTFDCLQAFCLFKKADRGKAAEGDGHRHPPSTLMPGVASTALLVQVESGQDSAQSMWAINLFVKLPSVRRFSEHSPMSPALAVAALAPDAAAKAR